MLKVKTRGHSLYNVKRRKEFIDSVETIGTAFYNESDSKVVAQRVIAAIQNQNSVAFGNELLFNDVRTLAVTYDKPIITGRRVDSKNKSKRRRTQLPLLHFCCYNRWVSGVKLIVAAVYHLNKMPKYGDSEYARKYFERDHIFIDETR